jgi:hypothetical protein
LGTKEKNRTSWNALSLEESCGIENSLVVLRGADSKKIAASKHLYGWGYIIEETDRSKCS